MKQYTQLLRRAYEEGVERPDRTGTGTKSVFGHQMRFDLTEGFPLLTMKKTNFHAIKVELLWFLMGDTNVEYLKDNKCPIWNEWADENGDLGPIYGKQWRSWEGASGDHIDQIDQVVAGLINDPFGRRHIVSAWNPDDLPVSGTAPDEQFKKHGRMALAPCHTLFQFYVEPMTPNDRLKWVLSHIGMDAAFYVEEKTTTPERINAVLLGLERYHGIKTPALKLSCQLYQRSADIFLGVPFNIASYALLTHMIAQVCGYGVGDFVHTFGDAHIYTNHEKQVEQLLSRLDICPLPKLWLNPERELLKDFQLSDIEVMDYNPQSFIKAPVAV